VTLPSCCLVLDTRTTLALLLVNMRKSTFTISWTSWSYVFVIFSSAGAVAVLFDLSCLSLKDNDKFEKIQDDAYEFWSKADDAKLKTFSIRHESFKLGDHFFQSNGNGGISPVWDFRGASAPNKANAFVVAAKVAGVAAPTGPQDVDWLQLNKVTGDLASSIYRTHTKGGQPPASVRIFVFCIVFSCD